MEKEFNNVKAVHKILRNLKMEKEKTKCKHKDFKIECDSCCRIVAGDDNIDYIRKLVKEKNHSLND